MQAVAGKTVDELPLVDWEEASMNCGGDMRDDAFLVDLMVCFCTEGIPRIKRLLQAALAYRNGEASFAPPGEPGRSFEVAIKEEAHALKGSAANVRLWKLAKACEGCELPCKAIAMNPQGAQARRELLDSFCIAPRTEISEVVRQFKAFTAFLQKDMTGMLEEGVDLDSALEPPTLDDLHDKCTPEYFGSAIEAEWIKFNDVSALPAAAGQPVTPPAATAALAESEAPVVVKDVSDEPQVVPEHKNGPEALENGYIDGPLASSGQTSSEGSTPAAPTMQTNVGTSSSAATAAASPAHIGPIVVSSTIGHDSSRAVSAGDHEATAVGGIMELPGPSHAAAPARVAPPAASPAPAQPTQAPQKASPAQVSPEPAPAAKQVAVSPAPAAPAPVVVAAPAPAPAAPAAAPPAAAPGGCCLVM